MAPQFIIAHDLGTTGNKATLYDADGQLVGSAFHGYDVEYAHPRWAEQDPEDWWRAVCVSTHKLLAETKIAGHEIACVYSQPPRPAGRGKQERPTPVHAFAALRGLEVRTPTWPSTTLPWRTSERSA